MRRHLRLPPQPGTGANADVARVQKAVVEPDYTTTRVLAGRHDLSHEVFASTVIPGRISAVRPADGVAAIARLRNAIPASESDLLNLRDMEHGLEKVEPQASVTLARVTSRVNVNYSVRAP